jgi:hypothetical protein
MRWRLRRGQCMRWRLRRGQCMRWMLRRGQCMRWRLRRGQCIRWRLRRGKCMRWRLRRGQCMWWSPRWKEGGSAWGMPACHMHTLHGLHVNMLLANKLVGIDLACIMVNMLTFTTMSALLCILFICNNSYQILIAAYI